MKDKIAEKIRHRIKKSITSKEEAVTTILMLYCILTVWILGLLYLVISK